MEDLGISPSSLSTSKSLRRKYNTIKSKSKAAAEASSKRRQEEEENNNTMMMDKLDVKTKIPGIPEKAVILEIGLGKSFIKKIG